MHNHLKLHGVSACNSPKKIDVLEPAAKRSKITSFYHSKNSIGYKVSRMAAIDGISLNVLANSYDLRQMMPDLPKSGNGVRQLILQTRDIIIEEIKDELSEKRSNG